MTETSAPYVFISYAHDSPDHKAAVRGFATFLRTRIGLNVHLDQWYDATRIDWAAWATHHLNHADFVVVIASPQYRRRADGETGAAEGRGSQFEALIIRDRLTRDVRRETGHVLPVVLPGRTAEDIPLFLTPYATTRYEIDAITDNGVAGLVAAITGRSPHPMPERGVWSGGVPDQTHVPLATGLVWTRHSAHVEAGTAWLDGLRYDDSILLRSVPPGTPGSGFVEAGLGGRFTSLRSVIGVLDSGDAFQVGHFRVFVDGRLGAQGPVAPGMSREIDVDVTAATTLRLELSRPNGSPALAWGDPALS